MKLVVYSSSELTKQRCWHSVLPMLLFLFTIGSISANQSVAAASRLVRQAGGQVAESKQVTPPLQSANLVSQAQSQSQTQQQQLQKQTQHQVQATLSTTTTASTSPPESPPKSPEPPQQTKRSGNNKNAELSSQQCEYEKEAWQACQSNGCKYARGEWSNTCTNGLRVRVDTLVGYANPNELENSLISNGQLDVKQSLSNKLDHSTEDKALSNFNCQPERKVMKDCRRACHYIKSAWSDCIDGFKTRNLTLDETPLLDTSIGGSDSKTDTLLSTTTTNKQPKLIRPSSSGCIRQKQLRRECRCRETQNVTISAPNKITQTASNNSTLAGKLPDRHTPAQRRRLKQLQRQQQQRGRQRSQQQQSLLASQTEQTTVRSNTVSKRR